MTAPRKRPRRIDVTAPRDRFVFRRVDRPGSSREDCLQGGSGKSLTSIRRVLRGWVRQADVDAGRRPGVTSNEAERIGRLEADNRQLRAANATGKRLRL